MQRPLRCTEGRSFACALEGRRLTNTHLLAHLYFNLKQLIGSFDCKSNTCSWIRVREESRSAPSVSCASVADRLCPRLGLATACPQQPLLTLPCSLQHQQQVAQAVERAKQVTMTELNAIIGVRGLPNLPLTVCIALLFLSFIITRDQF